MKPFTSKFEDTSRVNEKKDRQCYQFWMHEFMLGEEWGVHIL